MPIWPLRKRTQQSDGDGSADSEPPIDGPSGEALSAAPAAAATSGERATDSGETEGASTSDAAAPPAGGEDGAQDGAEASASTPARRRRGNRGGRKRRKSGEGVAVEGADDGADAAELAADSAAAPDGDGDQASAATPAKRRRRRKAAAPEGEAAGAAADATPEQAGEAAAEAAGTEKKKSRRKRKSADSENGDADESGSKRRRKRATPRRSQLPPVAKRMLVSVDVGETRVAILEDERVVEVYLERQSHRSVAGNIYKGVVDNVLPGMEASFIDIGLERNGFLYVDEIIAQDGDGGGGGRRRSRRISDLISRGQHVLVQAVKDPMGSKGARLTTEISLPGRFVVYVPHGDGIGVSRRLEDGERDRLKAICKNLELPEGGLIVRTAAEGASEAEIAGDIAFLRMLWQTIQERAERAKPRSLVYTEADLPLRLVRDLFIRDSENVIVDHASTHERLVGYLRRTSPELAEKVELYEGSDLMERHGVDAAIASTLGRRVDLPSGGYLIFDYAEALTVIDVNTGRFVGPRGRNAAGSLEDTITANNLEAQREIVRQLRLRDIGGIIVIDFIDMENATNRKMVEEALARELERDRTKTYVVEISPLGLVEMTRQNVTDGPREIITCRCPACNGEGVVPSEESTAIAVERRIRQAAGASRAEALLVELAPPMIERLVGPGGALAAALEQRIGRRLSFEPRADAALDHVAVLAEGSAAEIEPRGLPVEVGQELELSIGGRSVDGAEAIADVDGYRVAIAGAAGRAASTVRVRIERVTTAGAYAVALESTSEAVEPPVDAVSLIDADLQLDPVKPKKPRSRSRKKAEPVAVEEAGVAVAAETGEPAAEDEPKPKRSRRRTKTAESEPGQTADAASATETPEAGAVTEGAVTVAVDGTAEPAAPRKRSRRRTKAEIAADAEAAAREAGAVALSEEVVADAVRAEDEAGSGEGTAEGDGEPPKKRTRRGSRGGRGRRRKTTATLDGEAGEGESGEGEVADGELGREDGPASAGESALADESARTADPDDVDGEPAVGTETGPEPVTEPVAEPVKPKRTRTRRPKADAAAASDPGGLAEEPASTLAPASDGVATASSGEPAADEPVPAKPKRTRARRTTAAAETPPADAPPADAPPTDAASTNTAWADAVVTDAVVTDLSEVGPAAPAEAFPPPAANGSAEGSHEPLAEPESVG